MDQQNKNLNMEIPKLTLTPYDEQPSGEAKGTNEQNDKDIPVVKLNEDSLTPEELAEVKEFAKQIDITNSTVILEYGSAAQKRLSQFSETALNNVRTKDLGEVGGMLTSLVNELNGLNADSKKSSRGFFKRSANKLATMKTKYNEAEVNVNKICTVLEDHQVQLLKDVAFLDQLYEKNLVNFKEISMYILAGKRKLNEVREQVLPELVEKAKASGLPEDSQKANDMASFCDRFEKKIHDLELTRMISIQMAPQIRLVQNTDTLMAEKIQSTITNTIPLWKSQIALSLGIEHSAQAIEAQRNVTNMTNELLKKNAETLKLSTIEAAKESERGVVEIETLQHTNRMLIETLDEVIKIQDEGRQKRRSAEEELGKIEGEIKQKLLEIHT